MTKYYNKYKNPRNYISFIATDQLDWPSVDYNQIYDWNSGKSYHTNIVTTPTEYKIYFNFKIKSIIQIIQIQTYQQIRFPLKYNIYGVNHHGDTFLMHHQIQPVCTKLDSNKDCGENTIYTMNIPFNNQLPITSIIISNDGQDSKGTYCNSIGSIEFFGYEYIVCPTIGYNSQNRLLYLYPLIDLNLSSK